MSFQQAANNPPTISLTTNVQNFESRWATVLNNISLCDDSTILRRTRTLVKEMNILQTVILKRLETCSDEDKESLFTRFKLVNDQFDSRKSEILQILDKKEEEMKYNTISSAPPPQFSSMKSKTYSKNRYTQQVAGQDPLLNQSLLEGDYDLEYIHDEANDIAYQMQEINKVTHDLNNNIQDQHGILVNIDGTIDDAKNEMIEGNSDLMVAEIHQKSTQKATIIVSVVVCGVILLIVGAVCLYIFVFKK